MTTLAFSIAGVSASVLGGTMSDQIAVIGVKVGGHLSSICQIIRSGDEAFGALENRLIHFGSMRCCTTSGGVRMGADGEGRPFPELMLFKHVQLKVDCGRVQAGVARVAVDLEISDGLGQVKGPTLYKVESMMMPIWADTMSSDAEIEGYTQSAGQVGDGMVSDLFSGHGLPHAGGA